MSNYLIEFEDYLSFSVNQFIEIINKTEGIKLNELRVKDLTYYNNQFINPGHGIYIFKDDRSILLIGKARTMSFTERIAKHFDLRPNAWFNRLLFVINRDKEKFKIVSNNDEDGFKRSSEYVFNNAKLLLINIKSDRIHQIDKFENILRATAEPLNRFKRKIKDGGVLLSDI